MWDGDGEAKDVEHEQEGSNELGGKSGKRSNDVLYFATGDSVTVCHKPCVIVTVLESSINDWSHFALIAVPCQAEWFSLKSSEQL